MSFLKIVVLATYVFFLGLSCWATDEQTHPSEKGDSRTFSPRDTVREDIYEEDSLDRIRLSRTVGMAAEIMRGFQILFNPPLDSEAEAYEGQEPDVSFQQAIGLITENSDPESLLARASELVGQVSSDIPALKSSEYGTLMELAVRAGMRERPEYFFELKDDNSCSDMKFSIGFKFLQEFVNGSLDTWVLLFKKSIEDKEASVSQRTACLEFIDGVASVIKDITSGRDPLNKYVNPEEVQQFEGLKEWLKGNGGHEEYNKYQGKCDKLYEHIISQRDKALKEGAEYIHSLMRRIIFEPNQTERLKILKRQEFEAYVLEYATPNIFEPNHLRSFWDELYRRQYGELFYRIVCESFDPKNKDSQMHQAVYRIWCISHLDTINEHPQEARSRMPEASIDGFPASNFGYGMGSSEAYCAWLKNPFPRACGDIIMDAFHYAVDFGRNLDVGQLLVRLKMSLLGAGRKIYDEHEYGDFIIPLELFLLEDVFHQPFVMGEDRTIPSELKKAAGTGEDLFRHASEALEELKTFSKNMFLLRPSNEKLGEKDFLGLVFGIGFNGALFGSPNHTQKDDNEIWLSFSESGRKRGGYLFLSFLKHVATRHSQRIGGVISTNISDNFDRYKSLIRRHLSQKIKNTHEIPDFQWNRHMLEHIEKERVQFEGFMSQLEQDIPFKYLNPELRDWVKDVSNWYCIPHDISIRVPQEMPIEEHQAQYVARNLLFDALTERQFSKEYPELIPLLFLHWKHKILENMMDDVELTSLIQLVQNYGDIPEEHREEVMKKLDQIVIQICPTLKSTWQLVIEKEFRAFIKPKADTAREKIKAFEMQAKGIKKTLKSLREAKSDVSLKIETAEKDLKETEQSKQQAEADLANLPTTFSVISDEEYKSFRGKFFEDRDVSQCIEPVLARVLGHDRFFPVFISRKVGETDIKIGEDQRSLQLGRQLPQDVIAPCNKRCQHHVLGHLYVGDMLSYQSADRLDSMRQTHGQGDVPDRFLTFK